MNIQAPALRITPNIGAESGSHVVPEPIRVIGRPSGSVIGIMIMDGADVRCACSAGGGVVVVCATAGETHVAAAIAHAMAAAIGAAEVETVMLGVAGSPAQGDGHESGSVHAPVAYATRMTHNQRDTASDACVARVRFVVAEIRCRGG